MSNHKKLVGTALAVTAAFAFSAAPVSSAFADTTTSSIQCFGINSCKGQSACKTADNACKGQNSCKGKGVIMEPSAADCTKAGGTTSAS